MKTKIIIILLTLITIYFVAAIVIDKKNKEKWKIEITNEYINLRSEANTYSKIIGKVNKNEVYEVIKMETNDEQYYWYYIKIDNYQKGWVASNKIYSYLKDYNNPNDLIAPIVKYYEEIYKTKSIDTIKYDHLEIVDKTKTTITNEVYYEQENNQCWITYIVKDENSNETRKTQKIEFEIMPKHNQIKEM